MGSGSSGANGRIYTETVINGDTIIEAIAYGEPS